jgi:hypothetical protein
MSKPILCVDCNYCVTYSAPWAHNSPTFDTYYCERWEKRNVDVVTGHVSHSIACL